MKRFIIWYTIMGKLRSVGCNATDANAAREWAVAGGLHVVEVEHKDWMRVI